MSHLSSLIFCKSCKCSYTDDEFVAHFDKCRDEECEVDNYNSSHTQCDKCHKDVDNKNLVEHTS